MQGLLDLIRTGLHTKHWEDLAATQLNSITSNRKNQVQWHIDWKDRDNTKEIHTSWYTRKWSQLNHVIIAINLGPDYSSIRTKVYLHCTLFLITTTSLERMLADGHYSLPIAMYTAWPATSHHWWGWSAHTEIWCLHTNCPGTNDFLSGAFRSYITVKWLLIL